MATTYQGILTPALRSSTANDQGQTDLGNNTSELVAVVSRIVRKVYAIAGLPPSEGGAAYGNYFTRSGTVILGTPNTTYVSLGTTPEFVFLQNIVDNVGVQVSPVTLRDLRNNVAELPPCVVFADNKVRSAGRVGDPAAGATLTFDGSYLPAVATDAGHFIGATTATDSTTTAWVGGVAAAGDPFLVAQLALYLAQKDGSRDAAEIAGYTAQIQEYGQALAQIVGANVARVSDVRPA